MSGKPDPHHPPDSARGPSQRRGSRRHFSRQIPAVLALACIPSCRFGYEVLVQLGESPDDPPGQSGDGDGDGDTPGEGGDTGDGDTSLAGMGPGSGGSGGAPSPSAGGGSPGAAGAAALGGSAGEPYMGPVPDPLPPPSVSAGETHTCGVSADGSLHCFGANTSSSLGAFMGTESPLPVAIAGEGALGGFVGVAAGLNGACALRDDGSIWCFGANESGQLGQGDTMDRAEPVRVPLNLPAKTVTLNHRVACAIDEDGALYCWGWNFEGQMGQDDTPQSPVESTSPVAIPSPVPWADVSTGDGHVCAIRADGALYCWGRNSSGELGRDSPIQIRTPTRVGDENDWKLVRAAQSQTCAIKEDQSLWCWGSGTSGQLGIEPAEGRTTPTRVGAENDWVGVEPQALHACGLREDNSLWCWGRRQEGQLTLAYDANPILTPLLVDSNLDWDLVSCGRFHTCGRRSGVLYCTGENTDGRLGDGTLVRSYGFVPVQAF